MKEHPSSFLGLFAAMAGGLPAADYPAIQIRAIDRETGSRSKKFGRCKFRHMVAAGYYKQQVDPKHIHPRSKR